MGGGALERRAIVEEFKKSNPKVSLRQKPEGHSRGDERREGNPVERGGGKTLSSRLRPGEFDHLAQLK